MKKLIPLFFGAIVLVIASCTKEYSLENSLDGNNGLIVGKDCRISKIVYTDTATKLGIGSIAATINNQDVVTGITKFDSLSFTIDYIASPVYAGDTIYINADEYFITDVNKRIISLHALVDPTDPFSQQYDVNYFYSGTGQLTSKFYSFSVIPVIPFYLVTYDYVNGKLTHMTGQDLASGDLVTDADITYHNNILPNRFLYLFPDELGYPYFSQFYNFGTRPSNAPQQIKVRYYDPGNVLRDSTVTTFSNYIMSRDNYVLSCQMGGDDLASIPAAAGKLSFSYKCK